MSYIVRVREPRGDTYTLEDTKAETAAQAVSKLQTGRRLIHPLADIEVVPVDDPPANEDR